MKFYTILLIFTATIILLAVGNKNTSPKTTNKTISVISIEDEIVIGGWHKNRWITDQKIAKIMRKTDSYNIYSINRIVGKITGIKLKRDEIFGEYYFDSSNKVSKKDGLLAVSDEINALPRIPEIMNVNNGTYQDIVKKFLNSKGIKNPQVNITSLLRCDLDGDGSKEVIISATTPRPDYEKAWAGCFNGDYSCVLLRKNIGKITKTILIDGEFYMERSTLVTTRVYENTHILDLNGDGKMEIITRSHYYEGFCVIVYSIEKFTKHKIFAAGVEV